MPINPIPLPLTPTIDEASRFGATALEAAKIATVRALEKAVAVTNERVALVVAGVSYPRPQQGNVLDPKTHRTYFKLAGNYSTYLLGNGSVDRVVVLDFLLGQLRSFHKGGPKDGTVLQPVYEPIRVKNYRFRVNAVLTLKAPPPTATIDARRRLYYTGIDEFATDLTGDADGDVPKKDYDVWTGAKENSLSVADLYKRIRASIAGSIKEVHFVGHAWLGGPIIVNTPFYRMKKYDKDCRVSDFTNSDLGSVFDGQNLPHFRAAFTTDATLTVWGCENTQQARTLILAAKAKAAKNESIRSEVDELKKLVADTYAAQLAKTCGKPVYGALPGTYSVHEGEPNDDASGFTFTPTVMHVNLEKCEHILQFYKKELGITFPTTGAFKGHPTFGRGFAIYNP